MLQLRKPWTRQPQELARVNRGNPATVGLQGLWNLGVSYADATGINNGTSTSSTLIVPSVGPDGRTLDFSGAHTGITTPANTGIGAATSKTIVARIKIRTGFGGGNRGRIFDNGNGGSTGCLFWVDTLGSPQVQGLAFDPNPNAIIYSNSNVVAPDVWYTVAVTYDYASGVVRFYVNGVDVGGGTGSANILAATTNPGRIGARSDGARSFDGQIGPMGFWNRALSPAEIASVSTNLWQLFAPRSIWVPVSVAGGGVSGTSATTNANDTSSASGTTTITGTSATTNANDTSAASGTTTVTGTSATTNADDTSAASGIVGSGVSGTSATTNANDTSSASGTTTVTGTSATTNANDTATANGFAGAVGGTAAVTNANDTSQASGTAGGGAVDAHDGFWSREWERIRKREKRPTVAEVVEIIKETPQVVEMVRQEVEREYPQVDYAQVLANVKLQRFIARQLIEAAQEEDDIETMLLMA